MILTTAPGSSRGGFCRCILHLPGGILLDCGCDGLGAVAGGRRLRGLLSSGGLCDLRSWGKSLNIFIGWNKGNIAGDNIYGRGDERDVGCDGHRDV